MMQTTEKIRKILLAIPHSSTKRFNPFHWDRPELALKEAIRLTNWEVDQLFGPPYRSQIRRVVGSVSPLYCDLNQPLHPAAGQQGAIAPTRTPSGATREVPPERYERKILPKWEKYREKLSKRLSAGTLLIGCHSYPSDARDADIQIGYNEGAARPSQQLLDKMTAHFEAQGYKVELQTPCSNALTPKEPVDYQSVTIEVNQKLYWDEASRKRGANFSKLQLEINQLFDRLLGM